MKFTVHITLGNDAMQSGEDLAGSLRKLADLLEDTPTISPCDLHLYGVIMDHNGNKVGKWEVR